MTPTCQCHMGTARGQVFLISSIVWSHRFRPSPSWLVVTAVGRNCYSPVRGRFYSVSLVSHWGAYSVLLTCGNLCKPTPVKHVVVAAIVILNNTCRACFVYGFRQVLVRSAGRFYFVGALLFFDKLQTHLRALLLGRALIIGTLRYP